MKQVYYFLLAAALTFVSCDEMLNVTSESYGEADKITTPWNINVALMGCYNGMQVPLDNEWMFTELRSDNALQGQAGSSNAQNQLYNDLDMFRPSASMNFIFQYWSALYHNISNTNKVIQNIDKLELTDELKQYKGEALVIRSYHYFNLVRLFGPVFLTTEAIGPEDAKKMNRQPVDVVYQQLVDDLMLAADYLPAVYDNANVGRATKWTAKALLAKVYLTWSGKNDDIAYLTAADYLLDELQQAPATNSIGLLNNYADVFSMTNEMNREILFTVRFKSGGYGLGSKFANLFAPLGSGMIPGTCSGLNNPSYSIYEAYTNAGDIQRRDVAIGVISGKIWLDSLYVKKFFDDRGNNDNENDWPILRYSDVLLMSAEVKARLGDIPAGMVKLNQVHTRVGLTALPTPGGLAEFMVALQLERRLEFAFENDRFFDLVRWGTATQVLTNNIFVEDWLHYNRYVPAYTPRNIVDEWRLLLPIPQREIDTNNEIRIAQNPGY
ncbi:MAG: RagB/SusD family nutrient uptake outer membrane protein [Bacteroidales bacterium]|nr:RagB/SusD family nutrient uptake outer membrane protein [Bacteroidales bacterium]MCL2133497.1 RagB/SusD family nutrient uptake outer membrane protein [Bacteroidales bacterium]